MAISKPEHRHDDRRSPATCPASPVIRQRPTSISAKNSGGPKLNASRASGGATTISAIVATMPPMKEPIAAIPSAVPPRPCLAI